jgi:hypothetical protein
MTPQFELRRSRYARVIQVSRKLNLRHGQGTGGLRRLATVRRRGAPLPAGIARLPDHRAEK